MNSLNSILVEGNLTEDPQQLEKALCCTFTIGVDHYYKNNGEYKKETSYFDVEVWSKLADSCVEYLKKGRGVRVVGRLKQDRHDDVSAVKIVAEHVEFKPHHNNE
jgi:single-strand DNA-binding protein